MILVLAIFFFLILSAFFSGSEIAFISANKLGVEVMKNKSSRRAKILSQFYEKPRVFLSTMLIGNSIALVVFTYCMTLLLNPPLAKIFAEGPLLLFINTIISTIIVLIFGEFLPKTIFRLFANEILYFLALPLSFFKSILSPLTWITNKISMAILRTGSKEVEDKEDSLLSRLDLEHFLTNTFREGKDDIDKEIFTNALKLNQLKVRDCMIPRNEIVYVDLKASINEVVNEFKNSGHSRLVVIDADIENVKGYIHHGQLLQNPKSIKNLLLPIPFYPDVMNVRDLMLRFIKQSTNIACVVDEFGGTAGLITLEDILEEIFGDIEDEHDMEEFTEEKLGEREYLFSGRLELSYLKEKYPELNFPEGDFHTLSGYIVMTHGSIPVEGVELQLENYKFILEQVSDTKIETLRLVVPNIDKTIENP